MVLSDPENPQIVIARSLFHSKLPTGHEASARLCEERSDVAIQEDVWIAAPRAVALHEPHA